ncbi:hypothetical protein HGRIS_011304 [Hohenbuehelia grisea]|uniref:PH domain-containing protein n=1 Tax=Hohenbuehelia grisea TaxID=104357 RepID=A0ABR3JW20_9AGAR
MSATSDGTRPKSTTVFSSPSDPFSNSDPFTVNDDDQALSSAGDLQFHLQQLLEAKKDQLNKAALFGQQILDQQKELQERINQLQAREQDKDEDDEIEGESRVVFREIKETVQDWDVQNAQLVGSAFSPPNGLMNGKDPSIEITRDEHEQRPKAASSAAQSRRAKNAANRADNVEFALEIGSGLLTEVRRLQSLLGERDKAIQDMKEEKDDLEKTLESFRTALRQQEQSADKYKEENWNLEVTLQDLRGQLSTLNASSARAESEIKRLTKSLSSALASAESQKSTADVLAAEIEEIKTKHEMDTAQARRKEAGLARDKSDLQQALEKERKEREREKERRGGRGGRFGDSPLTPGSLGPSGDFLTPGDFRGMGDDDVFSTHGASTNRRRAPDTGGAYDEFGMPFADEVDADTPDPSPVRNFRPSPRPTNDLEALRQSLAHSQRTINTLNNKLQREKEAKAEMRRRLLENGIPVAEEADEEDEEEMFEDEEVAAVNGRPRRGTPYRRGRGSRARGARVLATRGKGMSLSERLTLAAQYPDDEADAPPLPPLPTRFSGSADDFFAEREDDEVPGENLVEEEPEPDPELGPDGKRASVDGMDPKFANVLRRTPSNASSVTHTPSPLRRLTLNRSVRGGSVLGRRPRGGAAFGAARPPSVVEPVGDLAKELGVGASPLRDSRAFSDADDLIDEVLGEEGIVDEEEADDTVRHLDDSVIQTAEFACQTEPEEPVAVPLKAETVDAAVQAEPEPEPTPAPIIVPEPIKVAAVDAQMQTDDEPVPARTEAATQHVPVESPAPITKQAETQTEVATSDMDTQTPTPSRPSVGVLAGYERDRRTTMTQDDVCGLSSASSGDVSGDTTITRPMARAFLAAHPGLYEENDDGEETETGAETEPETETDLDDYHDAVMSTPSASQEDFHSISQSDDFHSLRTMSDNYGSDSEGDDESIKASKLSSRMAAASTASSIMGVAEGSRGPRQRPSSYYPDIPAKPEVVYEDKGVSADLLPVVEPPKQEEPAPPVVAVPEPQPEPPKEEPKPELKEMSIQTDEWVPPAPPAPIVVPAPSVPPASPSLYRVGSASHQFQFIPAPASAGPTRSSTIPVPVSSVLNTTPGRGVGHDRRLSIDSTISSVLGQDDAAAPPQRFRVQSTGAGSVLSVVDKSKPPTMILPPPPRLPPPPNAMPPPSFIPERKATISSSSADGPPPRPSSPPPPELIQRATTPTFGAALGVPGRNRSLRQHGSTPTPHQALRQPPSTNSFRSAANAALYAEQALLAQHQRDQEHRQFSSTSLASERSMASPRSSISSDNVFANQPHDPVTPSKTGNLPMRSTPGPSAHGSTDPTIIHAITQTMIGEFLYKYTRRAIGKGYGQQRHKRFFWVHPYTKTLYWSSADPGSWNVSESSAKSAYIEGVRSVLDPNPMPPGLYQYSVVVSTPQREMKITAPTKERHDIWLNALKYLLARPNDMNVASPANATIVPQSPKSVEFTDDEHLLSPLSQRSTRSARRRDTWNTTPRGKRSRSQLSVGGSVGKRSGTPAAEYLRWNGPESPYSPDKSFEHIGARDEEDLDFELHGDSRSDDGFEGLENVRACCDGRHTVGHSGKHHHHHHNHNHNHLPIERTSIDRLEVNQQDQARPASPAWSFRSHRSRGGSSQSHEGGPSNGTTSIFSWGRGDDGKLRFGSRRSAKTVPTHDQ